MQDRNIDRSLTDRELARTKLQANIASQRRLLADPHGFSTFDPNWLIEDAEFRLRWIDCAPEGARFIIAPLCDKQGVPMGGRNDENIGAGKAVRAARAARGLDPVNPYNL